MEILKRKVKSEREENQDQMNVSLINGIRLSLRWADKEKPETDIVINLTVKETELIKNIIKGEKWETRN